jgi:hypothetical protein
VLTVSYSSASEFVSEYGENLANGGVFVRGATLVGDLLREVDVEIVLPGSTTLLIRAKPVFVLDEASARAAGRPAGTGMEITAKPFGFDAALRKHLMKLGKRREVAIMVGDVPGAARFGDAGYKLIPLEPLEALTSTLSDGLVQVIALVVPRGMVEAYSTVARSAGKFVAVHGVTHGTDVDDVIAKIDKLLGTGTSTRLSTSEILKK